MMPIVSIGCRSGQEIGNCGGWGAFLTRAVTIVPDPRLTGSSPVADCSQGKSRDYQCLTGDGEERTRPERQQAPGRYLHSERDDGDEQAQPRCLPQDRQNRGRDGPGRCEAGKGEEANQEKRQ